MIGAGRVLEFMTAIHIILLYLLIINLCGFASMGIDKRRAIRHKWRISEATLFVLAILGGSIGSIIGMHTFHHKTKHWYFVWGMPLILILQIGLIVMLKFIPGLSITIM